MQEFHYIFVFVSLFVEVNRESWVEHLSNCCFLLVNFAHVLQFVSSPKLLEIGGQYLYRKQHKLNVWLHIRPKGKKKLLLIGTMYFSFKKVDLNVTKTKRHKKKDEI
jgi:hypothetical protein